MAFGADVIMTAHVGATPAHLYTLAMLNVLEAYDLKDEDSVERLSHAKLAKQFDLDPATVNNYLAAARREFRKIVLEKLGEITATEEEFRTEARLMLGLELK